MRKSGNPRRAGLVLRHDALKTALTPFGQQALAIVEWFRIQETGDPGTLD